MNILLKKNNLFKLRLLSCFLEFSMSHTTKTLLTILKLDKQKLQKQLSLLNSDLYELFGSDVRILKLDDSYQLKITSELTHVQLLELLKMHYLEQSTPFEIVQALFRRNYYSIEELATDLHLAPSYVYKQLIHLKKKLNPLGVELTFAQEYGESNIICDEAVLRYFISAFYWSSYKTIKLPVQRTVFDSDKVMMDKITPYINSPSKQQHLRYYIAYSVYRSTEKKKGLELDEQFIRLATLLQQTNDTSIYRIEEHHSELSTILKNENLFFNFAARTFLAIDKEVEQIQLAKQFAAIDLPLTQFAKEFINAVLSQWHLRLPESDYYQLLYQLTITLLLVRYIGISFYEFFNYSETFSPDLLASYIPKKKSKEIQVFYSRLKKQFAFVDELNIDSRYSHIVHNWIYFIIDFAKDKQLKVTLQFSKDALIELFIRNKIKSTFNEKSILFVEDTTRADIVITDFSEPSIENTNVFFINNILEERTWESLFYWIQKKLLEKSFDHKTAPTYL